MKNKMRRKGEQHLIYNMKICKKKGDFDILNEISENVTLVQLMDTLVNVYHAISIVHSWVFGYNYKNHFV